MTIEKTLYLEPVKLGIASEAGIEEKLVYAAGIHEIEGEKEFHYYP